MIKDSFTLGQAQVNYPSTVQVRLMLRQAQQPLAELVEASALAGAPSGPVYQHKLGCGCPLGACVLVALHAAAVSRSRPEAGALGARLTPKSTAV